MKHGMKAFSIRQVVLRFAQKFDQYKHPTRLCGSNFCAIILKLPPTKCFDYVRFMCIAKPNMISKFRKYFLKPSKRSCRLPPPAIAQLKC